MDDFSCEYTAGLLGFCMGVWNRGRLCNGNPKYSSSASSESDSDSILRWTSADELLLEWTPNFARYSSTAWLASLSASSLYSLGMCSSRKLLKCFTRLVTLRQCGLKLSSLTSQWPITWITGNLKNNYFESVWPQLYIISLISQIQLRSNITDSPQRPGLGRNNQRMIIVCEYQLMCIVQKIIFTESNELQEILDNQQ